MPDSTLSILPFDAGHFAGAVALSQAEQWPHRLEDWQLAMGVSRGVVALENGEVAGTACTTPFGDVAMLNMIIVSPKLRGRGVGARLMAGAMALATPKEWRLVATEAGLPLYRKLGFRETGRVVQLQGLLEKAPASEPSLLATPADLPEIAALDLAATGMERRALLTALAEAGVFHLIRENGRLTGFAALRRFGRGWLLGPVIARDGEAAKSLMSGLMVQAQGAFLRVDIPEVSGLAPWLEGLGLARAGGGTTMAKGGDIPVSAEFTSFALAAQALG